MFLQKHRVMKPVEIKHFTYPMKLTFLKRISRNFYRSHYKKTIFQQKPGQLYLVVKLMSYLYFPYFFFFLVICFNYSFSGVRFFFSFFSLKKKMFAAKINTLTRESQTN